MYFASPSVNVYDLADPKAERQLEQVESRHMAEQILRALTPVEQLVIILFFWCGFTLTEIAYLRGVSKQSTQEAYARALRKGREAAT